MGDTHVGLQARLMSQALRKLTGAISNSKDVHDLHQPDPREDRRDVRQPGNHRRAAGRSSSTPRSGSTSAARAIKEGDKTCRLAHARPSRQEQGRPAVPPSRIRHHLRSTASRRWARFSTSRSSRTSSARAVRGTPTAISVSVKAERMRSRSSKNTSIWPARSKLKIREALGKTGSRNGSAAVETAASAQE